MSGWDDGKGYKIEIGIDLQQASEWMADLDDDLTEDEKHEALRTVIKVLSEKWTDEDPEDQKKPEIREHPNDIRPSEVRMTELEPETGKVQFYSGFKVLTDKWLGSRNLEDWPEIFVHMKKSMNPDTDDAGALKLRWLPKEN